MNGEKEILAYSITAAHMLMKEKKLSVKEFVDVYVKTAKESNPEINAYLEIFDDIDVQVRRAQEMFDNGAATVLTGIPIAVKDNILIKGKIASGASKILENHRATYDATVIERLKELGVVFIGRTNMDEFAMGSTTENSAFGVTKNPVDKERVPGGTSGGSAAAVKMMGALVALGSDTGGSVRLPAAFCGLVGIKPTYGSVSRYGLMATASSLDQIGTLARTVEDAAILYRAIAGHDPMDSTSLLESKEINIPKEKKLTIGVPREFIDVDGMDPDVRDSFQEKLKEYEKRGHRVVDISIPSLAHALPAYYIINPAEISANLARYDGIRYGVRQEGDTLGEVYMNSRAQGFGKEVRRRILLGTYVLSAGYYDAYYNKANALREVIRKDLEKAFKEVDVIATPTAPTPAYKIGEKSSEPLAMYLGDVFTVTANVAGVPSLSIPMKEVKRDHVMLPTGFQLLGPHQSEELLIYAAQEGGA